MVKTHVVKSYSHWDSNEQRKHFGNHDDDIPWMVFRNRVSCIRWLTRRFCFVTQKRRWCFQDGLPKQSRWKDRWGRCGVMVRCQRRSSGTATSVGTRDYRPSEGSLFHEESSWWIRMQTLSHTPQQWRLILISFTTHSQLLKSQIRVSPKTFECSWIL